jgi:Xaa-Pro aminopeptidase
VNFILKNENAVYYECGFSCDNVIFLKVGSEAFFITDGRYTTEAKEQIKNAEVVKSEYDLQKTAREILRKHKVKKIIYDPLDWSVEDFYKLSYKLKCYFKKEINFSQKKRIIKTDNEIELLKNAVNLGKEGFDAFARYINNEGIGKSEKRLFFKAIEILTKSGELATSFNPIVAIDENAAKPHALPSDKKLKHGDILLFDAGIKYKRYCSDRTRMMEINGEINFKIEQKFRDKKRQKIYDTVLKAKDEAFKKVKEGVKAKDIDKAARDVIEKAGYGKYFIHSTGHGVGLDIHELPVISKRSDTVLRENMVFTIEPGIYLPGEFGVRIEDMVTIKNSKGVVL